MNYPNVMAPSPQEIYDGLKMIPNNQQGKQMLSGLAQQGKQTGSIEGGIAAAILNSYNKAQSTPPAPPQGQVVDQVIQSAQATAPTFPLSAAQGAITLHPMTDPNTMGLAMPGLEELGQQQAAQRMAGGGIVALAGGGPVRGFDMGGVADLAQDSPWMGGMPQVPDAPDISNAVQDYTSTPTPASAAAPASPVKRTYEDKLNKMQELYGVPPDVAAEIISQHEHENARRSKFNAFENIASALGGYLGSYGSGQHRVGAGLASMLGTMGEHQRAEDKEQATMDVLRAKSLMAPYEQRKTIMDQILASETAGAKAEREAQQKMAELAYGHKSKMQEGQQRGEYGLQEADISAGASMYGADKRAENANQKGPSGMTRNQSYVAAGRLINPEDYDSPQEAEAALSEMADKIFRHGLAGVGVGGAGTSASPSYGQPLQLGGGAYTGWLR